MNTDPITRILDRGRWAPSGDNTQPWRFQILDEGHVRVHAFDTRDDCVYDLDGHPSQISVGALLETLAIAASAEGMRMSSTRDESSPETRPIFDIRFERDPGVVPSRLAAVIESRSVQRRPLSTRPLAAESLKALQASVGEGFRVHWYAEAALRRQIAKLLFHSAKLRLITKEAYHVHCKIIEWGATTSVDRVPDAALGASGFTVALMRQVLKSWPRVQFFNRFLAGTWAPRIELDVVPALACATHFVIAANQPAKSIDDYVEAGRAAQRFWLTAAAEGLQLQPEITPLVFSRYAREGVRFSELPASSRIASEAWTRLQTVLGADIAARAVFMGRLGYGPAAKARSKRMELSALMVRP